MKNPRKRSTEGAVLNVFPAIFFWKFAEVLGQRLKSWLWKIALTYYTADKDHAKIL